MSILNTLVERARKGAKVIVLPEGQDARVKHCHCDDLHPLSFVYRPEDSRSAARSRGTPTARAPARAARWSYSRGRSPRGTRIRINS